MTTIILAPPLTDLRPMTWGNVEDARRGMGLRTLNIQDAKTHNILFHPDVLPIGIYRRAPLLSNFSTKTRQRIQFAREARAREAIVEFDPATTDPLPIGSLQDTQGFPDPLPSEARILGITFDPRVTLDAHFRALLAKAQLRQGILSRVARTSWDWRPRC